MSNVPSPSGIRKAIIDRQILIPPDLDRMYRMPGHDAAREALRDVRGRGRTLHQVS